MVYTWEHYYYRANGVDTKLFGAKDVVMAGASGNILETLKNIKE